MKRSTAIMILLTLAPLEGTFLGQSAQQETQKGDCETTNDGYQFDFPAKPFDKILEQLKSDPQTLNELGCDPDISFKVVGKADCKIPMKIDEHSLREVVDTLTSQCAAAVRSREGPSERFLVAKRQNHYTIYAKGAAACLEVPDPEDSAKTIDTKITYNHRLKGITTKVAVSQLATVHPSPAPIPSPIKKDEKWPDAPKRHFKSLEYSPVVHLNSVLFRGTLKDIQDAVKYLDAFDETSHLISIELMVVQYVHGDRFQWGYDLTAGTTSRFTFDPGNPIRDTLSFTYKSVEKLTENFKFNLSVLSAQNRAKIVTNPRISVRSGETGSIRLDQELHLVLSNPSSAFGSVLSLETIISGVNLTITPHLAGKDLIILDVRGEVAVLTASSRESHSIDRNTVVSKVHVKEDETLILGGLIEEVILDNESGIPGLRSIPVLGYLFKSRTKRSDYIETVIYITPSAINGERRYGKKTNIDLSGFSENEPARKRVSKHMHEEYPKPPGSDPHLPKWHPVGQPAADKSVKRR